MANDKSNNNSAPGGSEGRIAASQNVERRSKTTRANSGNREVVISSIQTRANKSGPEDEEASSEVSDQEMDDDADDAQEADESLGDQNSASVDEVATQLNNLSTPARSKQNSPVDASADQTPVQGKVNKRRSSPSPPAEPAPPVVTTGKGKGRAKAKAAPPQTPKTPKRPKLTVEEKVAGCTLQGVKWDQIKTPEEQEAAKIAKATKRTAASKEKKKLNKKKGVEERAAEKVETAKAGPSESRPTNPTPNSSRTVASNARVAQTSAVIDLPRGLGTVVFETLPLRAQPRTSLPQSDSTGEHQAFLDCRPCLPARSRTFTSANEIGLSEIGTPLMRLGIAPAAASSQEFGLRFILSYASAEHLERAVGQRIMVREKSLEIQRFVGDQPTLFLLRHLGRVSFDQMAEAIYQLLLTNGRLTSGSTDGEPRAGITFFCKRENHFGIRGDKHMVKFSLPPGVREFTLKFLTPEQYDLKFVAVHHRSQCPICTGSERVTHDDTVNCPLLSDVPQPVLTEASVYVLP